MDHDHTPDPVDAIDDLARRAGAALRQPPPPDALDRLRTARRRRQATHPIVAGVAILAIGAITFAVLHGDGEGNGTVSPVTTSTDSPTTTSEPPATTLVSTALALPYTFGAIDGLSPKGKSTSGTLGATDELSSVWADTRGVPFGFLTLRDIPGTGEHSVDGDVAAEPFEVPEGDALIVTDNGAENIPAATRVMWWRPDGRLWIIGNYGMDRERLMALAVMVRPGSGVPHVLPTSTVQYLGSGSRVGRRSTVEEWELDDATIILSAAEGGLASQLVDYPLVDVTSLVVDGEDGFLMTMPNGQRGIIWPSHDDEAVWYRIDLSATVQLTTAEIVAALIPVDA